MSWPASKSIERLELDRPLQDIARAQQPRHSQNAVVVLSRELAEQWGPRPGEIALSIGNPRQSHAQLSPAFADLLRLGFHDSDREGGGFSLMTPKQARAVLKFALEHRNAPIMVHCQAGASRSVGIGLYLAAWLTRPLDVLCTDVLIPNPWVINQLRAASVSVGLRRRSTRLIHCSAFGSPKWLAQQCPAVRTGSDLIPLTNFQ